jgi:Calcium-activated chloride channel.
VKILHVKVLMNLNILQLYCVSLPIVLLCMVGAFFFMLVSFWAEGNLITMKKQQGLEPTGLVILLPSVVYSATVFVMNTCYRKLATWLTEWGK